MEITQGPAQTVNYIFTDVPRILLLVIKRRKHLGGRRSKKYLEMEEIEVCHLTPGSFLRILPGLRIYILVRGGSLSEATKPYYDLVYRKMKVYMFSKLFSNSRFILPSSNAFTPSI